ncbi:hypothetical protein DL89DRAFT_266601 [Linderina pennispora]|uniref:Uncharacterized protein n=1 Tax=Linderina pennispora TaxID=61395 RepID=A0A1Y1WDY1_9FUNG|nr:uncharacterized protein DL89DRAFT_266601 [Linderina pennispora]ORX71605.1 hypothetical protein DL89DRAFT_266601 [Linderina pennispora]
MNLERISTAHDDSGWDTATLASVAPIAPVVPVARPRRSPATLRAFGNRPLPSSPEVYRNIKGFRGFLRWVKDLSREAKADTDMTGEPGRRPMFRFFQP